MEDFLHTDIQFTLEYIDGSRAVGRVRLSYSTHTRIALRGVRLTVLNISNIQIF